LATGVVLNALQLGYQLHPPVYATAAATAAAVKPKQLTPQVAHELEVGVVAWRQLQIVHIGELLQQGIKLRHEPLLLHLLTAAAQSSSTTQQRNAKA
jgi:hypothetical protein